MEEQFQQRLKEVCDQQTHPPALLQLLDSLPVCKLSELLPGLSSTGCAYTPVEAQALRDTVQAVIYRKLTESLVKSITDLDKSTGRLTKVTWWLTIVVGLAGILVSVVMAWR